MDELSVSQFVTVLPSFQLIPSAVSLPYSKRSKVAESEAYNSAKLNKHKAQNIQAKGN